MAKVVITGNCGFIFSHVTDYFLSKGYEVHGLDNLSIGSHPELLNGWLDTGRFYFHKVDVDNHYVTELIKKISPDYIIHAAAISDVDESIKHPKKIFEKNNRATLNIFEVARVLPNLKKLVYVSTDEVYGECAYKKEEHEILYPKNPYACSKAFGSLMRITYDNTYPELKDKTAETRFCNVFGERQDSRKILARIKESLKTNEPIPVHNDGNGYREYIYVANIPPIVEQIMLFGNRVYNITTNNGFTVRALIDKIEKTLGKKIRTITASRSGMDMVYQMSNERVTKEFSWKPEFSFEDSLIKYLKND